MPKSYRYLVESIRKFPKPAAFAEMISGAGFSRVNGKAFRAASWRYIRAGVCDFCAHSHPTARTRRFRVRARRRFWRRRPKPRAAAWATRAAHRRLIERPGAKSGLRLSFSRADPARAGLPSSLGSSLPPRPARGRRHDGARPGKPAGSACRAFPASRSRGGDRAESLERPLTQAFVSLGPAVAAASIAQLHRGETERNGVRKSVAVKVLRPDVGARFPTAISPIFSLSARKAEAYSAEARRLRLIEVINTMSRSVAMEMDLRLEAAALSEMAENTRDDPDFRVPAVRLGSHHAQRADDGVGRRHRAQRSRASRKRR